MFDADESVPEGHVHARLDHLRHGGAAGGELQVRNWAVYSRHAALGQQAHVLRRDPDAVGRNGARVKDMVAVEHLRGCQAVSLEALFVLSLCLGQVDVHTGLLVDGKFAQRVPKAVVRGIFAVHGGLDADAAVVIAVPLFLQGDQARGRRGAFQNRSPRRTVSRRGQCWP